MSQGALAPPSAGGGGGSPAAADPAALPSRERPGGLARWLPFLLLLIPLFLLVVVRFTPKHWTSAKLRKGTRIPETLPNGVGKALPLMWEIPDFSLTSQDGRPCGRGALLGKAWIADFIFTKCSGTCVTLSSRLGQLQKLLGGRPDVRLVSFTVDPERDTPEALREFAARYGADPNVWVFLTGGREEIQRLAREGFKVSASTDEKGNITHSDRFVLVDPWGRARAIYNGTDADAHERAFRDALRVLDEKAP